MGIPIGELQQRVSSREFAEYWAYAQLEPFGAERDDLRAGIVASTIANVNRDRKRRPSVFAPTDFMPRFGIPAEPDDDEEGAGADEGADVDQEALARKIGEVMMTAFGGVQRGEA